jgi:transposase-like protein
MMIESEAFRICPSCGSQEVPKLILGSASTRSGGSRWECRSCHFDWSDGDDNQLWAS